MNAILSAVVIGGLLVLQAVARADFDDRDPSAAVRTYSSSSRLTPGCTRSPLAQ